MWKLKNPLCNRYQMENTPIDVQKHTQKINYHYP